MRNNSVRAIALAAALPLVALTACTTTDPSVTQTTGPAPALAAASSPASKDWFDQTLYDTQNQQRSATFEGNPEQPYLQYIAGPMTDTSKFKAPGAHKVCFANASISNPWRQTGWITMNQQLKALQASGVISEMETRDAKDNDNTQIADIDYFIAEGKCDAFVISPNSTAALTQAVERACQTGKPVVVFDRGVETDCATTFIHPIGGFAWGIDTATFLSDKLSPGTRWLPFASSRVWMSWSTAGRRPRRSSRKREFRPRTTSPAPTPRRSRRSSPMNWPQVTSRASGWTPETVRWLPSRPLRMPARRCRDDRRG